MSFTYRGIRPSWYDTYWTWVSGCMYDDILNGIRSPSSVVSNIIGFGVPFIMINGEIFLTQEFPKNYILINLLYKLPEIIILSYIILFKPLFFVIFLEFTTDLIFMLILLIVVSSINYRIIKKNLFNKKQILWIRKL